MLILNPHKVSERGKVVLFEICFNLQSKRWALNTFEKLNLQAFICITMWSWCTNFHCIWMCFEGPVEAAISGLLRCQKSPLRTIVMFARTCASCCSLVSFETVVGDTSFCLSDFGIVRWSKKQRNGISHEFGGGSKIARILKIYGKLYNRSGPQTGSYTCMKIMVQCFRKLIVATLSESRILLKINDLSTGHFLKDGGFSSILSTYDQHAKPLA